MGSEFYVRNIIEIGDFLQEWLCFRGSQESKYLSLAHNMRKRHPRAQYWRMSAKA